MPLEDLKEYKNNTKLHPDEQIKQIAASIIEFGFNDPVAIDEVSSLIIEGHGRYLAAKELGMKEIPVIKLGHLTETQRRAYAIAHNKLTLNTGFDEELLRKEFEYLQNLDFDLELTGFNMDEIGDILVEDFEEKEGLCDEDEVPEAPKEAISKPGDLYILGNHRVMCGDSTKKEDVELLMGNLKADMVFTDPPYNVNIQGGTAEKLKIQSDSMSADDYMKFLIAIFTNYRLAVKDNASLYICHASLWQKDTEIAMNKAGIDVRTQIIWAKNTFAWGFGRYKFQHEPIFYSHIKEKSDEWYGDKTQSTLWEEKKPAANREHPTMKPVELVERALQNSSKSGDIVLDLFGGSGTTLIACEKKNRKCLMMEIDPIYCDVIIARWEKFTGKKAVLSK
ncbi:MAG: site-specific DNA-methyltransferase [Desulfobacterales bacterium]|nr:site-specific DNA-methyltransferase [Desulfobacterales bacterium]